MATRQDLDKLDWSLLPVEPLEEAIKVLMFGVQKYTKDNWRTPPFLTRDRITNSLKRHQAAIDKGEDIDLESGLRHSACLLVNAIFQNYYEVMGLFNVNESQPDLNEKCECCFNYPTVESDAVVEPKYMDAYFRLHPGAPKVPDHYKNCRWGR